MCVKDNLKLTGKFAVSSKDAIWGVKREVKTGTNPNAPEFTPKEGGKP
jgi:hypothetical protein